LGKFEGNYPYQGDQIIFGLSPKFGGLGGKNITPRIRWVLNISFARQFFVQTRVSQGVQEVNGGKRDSIIKWGLNTH